MSSLVNPLSDNRSCINAKPRGREYTELYRGGWHFTSYLSLLVFNKWRVYPLGSLHKLKNRGALGHTAAFIWYLARHIVSKLGQDLFRFQVRFFSSCS